MDWVSQQPAEILADITCDNDLWMQPENVRTYFWLGGFQDPSSDGCDNSIGTEEVIATVFDKSTQLSNNVRPLTPDLVKIALCITHLRVPLM